MRFLFPLFLAAAAAIGVPILLHMARRRTRREVPFGSLMFLEASPPRFERRQRIEHWALLALRCLVLVLLAVAFARPFVARPVPALAAGTGLREVVLVDTSASMRRGSLWSDAVARAREVAAEAGAAGKVAILAFDRRPRTVLGFDTWAAMSPGARAQAASDRLAALAPSWQSTDLGRALVAAAEAIVDDEGDAPSSLARVVLISDLQEGSRLDALGISDWPARIELRVSPLETGGGNAWLQALPELTGSEPTSVRVRVTSTAGSAETLRVRWQEQGGAVDVKLAAGQTRVIEAPARPGEAPGTLVLDGDAAEFDDRLYLAPPIPAQVKILYLGSDDGTDAQQPLFYLKRAFPITRLRAPEVIVRRADAGALGELKGIDLAVLTAAPAAPALQVLRAHLQAGRTVLVAADAETTARALAQLAGSTSSVGEAQAAGDTLLTEVDLTDPILSPFADARFGDFTRIRFWHHRRLDEKSLRQARVVARFEDGAAAWLVVPAGRGQLFVMASGWQPADSQLALSTKFVPLLHGILEASAGLDSGQAQFFVGDPVALPATEHGARRVHKPDGQVVTLESEATVFADTDQPGLYRLEAAGGPRVFAVNLDPAESATSPLPPEALERRGLIVNRAASRPAAQGRERAFYAGLEHDQALWRWLIAAALGVLLLEALLAARASGRTA